MIRIINILFVCLILLIIIIHAFHERKFSEKANKRFLMVYTIVISIFLSLRVIGLDLEPHRLWFESSGSSFSDLTLDSLFSSRLEPFFNILSIFLNSRGFGYEYFLLIAGSIPMIILYNIIKNEQNPVKIYCVFLLIYLIKGPIEVIRGFFAAIVYLSAIYSLSKGEKLKAYIKNVSTILFHFSSVASIILFPFLKAKWTKKKYLITLFLTIFLTIFFRVVVFPQLISINYSGENYIIWKFFYYLTYYNSGNGYHYLGRLHVILLNFNLYFIIIMNILIILISFKYYKLIEKDTTFRVLMNSQIIGSFVNIIFIILSATTIGYRLSYLFSIGNFMLLSKILFVYNNNNKNKNWYVYLTFLFLLLYNFMIILYEAGVHNPDSMFYLGW
ncbi:EpsG family protein [Niallia sp. HCP3S3_B10]|uniref:EpsG family protein n=1 Tax=Niallia sp. HCP3S3_B10 TaxID=3438944 RepID=UPI003F89FC6E